MGVLKLVQSAVLGGALSLAFGAAATTFTPPLDKSEWIVIASQFACGIRHPVPFYGEAQFLRRAGEKLGFSLKPANPRLKTGKAKFVAKAPMWRRSMGDIDLGYVPVQQGMAPVKLADGQSNRALTELLGGRELVFTRYPWYGATESTQIALSPIRFQDAYQSYLDCLVGLLPVNFEQINRTAVYFPSSGDLFPAAERRKLDHIALYMKADERVTHLYVDGHTDSKGVRDENLELSKRRAEEVASYLRAAGVKDELITVRWHGERYPVALNQNVKGRAQNRRVTLRLERKAEDEPVTVAGNTRN